MEVSDSELANMADILESERDGIVKSYSEIRQRSTPSTDKTQN